MAKLRGGAGADGRQGAGGLPTHPAPRDAGPRQDPRVFQVGVGQVCH